MDVKEDTEFKLRFTFAGRLLLLLTLIAAVVFGCLLLLYVAELKISSFPAVLPFGIGAVLAGLFFGLMRVVYRVCGIQFWSATELERRCSQNVLDNAEAKQADFRSENGDADQDPAPNP